MRNKESLALAVVVLLAVLLPAPNLRGKEASARTATLQSKLNQIISCEFDETPLSDVLDFFRTTLEINIVYDPIVGDYDERFVTLQLTDMTARSALGWAVRLAGLEFTQVGEVLYVSSHENVLKAGPAYFRQYDVRDLLLISQLGDRRRDRRRDRDRDDGDRNNRGNNRRDSRGGGSRDAERELLNTIVLFTGAENWDYVEVAGASETTDSNVETESREDRF